MSVTIKMVSFIDDLEVIGKQLKEIKKQRQQLEDFKAQAQARAQRKDAANAKRTAKKNLKGKQKKLKQRLP